jgi:hypothetical protein
MLKVGYGHSRNNKVLCGGVLAANLVRAIWFLVLLGDLCWLQLGYIWA